MKEYLMPNIQPAKIRVNPWFQFFGCGQGLRWEIRG